MTSTPIPRYPIVALGVLAAVTLVYSVLVRGAFLIWAWSWLAVAATAVLLYLTWRFVRAVERLAAGIEDGTCPGDGTDPTDDSPAVDPTDD